MSGINMEKMMRWVEYSNAIGWNFNGRARRSEYWWNCLYYILVNLSTIILSIIIMMIYNVGVIIITSFTDLSSDFLGNLELMLGFISAFLLISITLVTCIWATYRMIPILVRRMHDRNVSGWVSWLLMLVSCFYGIGAMILLMFLCLDSEPKENQYGPNPKNIMV